MRWCLSCGASLRTSERTYCSRCKPEISVLPTSINLKLDTYPLLAQSEEVTQPGNTANARHTLTYIDAVRLVNVVFRIPAAWLITDFRIANRLYILDGDKIPARIYQERFHTFTTDTIRMGTIFQIEALNIGKHPHQLTALFTGACYPSHYPSP